MASFDVCASMDADHVVRQMGPIGNLKLGLLSSSGAERLSTLSKALESRRFRAYPLDETVLTDALAFHLPRCRCSCIELGWMPLRDATRFVSRQPFLAMIEEGIHIGESRRVAGIATPPHPTRPPS